MNLNLQAEIVPLREDADGGLRIGNTRVLLELVISAFQEGSTPESLVQRYSTLTLADVYAVIGWYLRHRSEVEEYLAEREQKAAEVRERIESRQGDLAEIRERMAKRRAQTTPPAK
jgi:uncharacterized protein (DUF433 family)